MKLCQVIALVGGRKMAIQKLLTGVLREWERKGEKSDVSPFTGISRTYQPKTEDGERLPSEQRLVQLKVSQGIKKVQRELWEFWDLVATQEMSNTTAFGDIECGSVQVTRVPVSVLLFLEKQLTDLATLVSKVPTLPVDKQWTWDPNKECYVAEAEESVRTKKMQKPLVLYPATPEHPAQTQLIVEDETVGRWTTIHLSGAIPASEQTAILERIERLKDAVKVAREQANSTEIVPKEVGGVLLNYIFGKSGL